MKLYYTPGACSLAPHIVLREAGFKFDLEKVDLRNKTTASGTNFLTVNAKGYVPALQLDDGQVLTEASVLIQYLADQRPRRHLAPPLKTLERYRMMEWLNFISTELHKQFSPLFDPSCPPELRQAQIDRLGKRFDMLAPHLESNEYLLGTEFSVADAYLFTILNWTNFMKIDLGRWPALQKYMGRIGGRPAVKKALKAEGLGKAS
jgi:glutathione S-transferase